MNFARVIFALMLSALAATAAAQWPNKPVRLIIPFPAGSATDTVGRILGQSVSAAIGQPILVENKAGADGAIAGQEVAKGGARRLHAAVSPPTARWPSRPP